MKSTKPELREEMWSVGGRTGLTDDILFYRLEWDSEAHCVRANQYRGVNNEFQFKRTKLYKSWDEAHTALKEAGYVEI